MTPAGIEPAIFRFATQHINHCASAIPTQIYKTIKLLKNQLNQ